MSVYHNTPLKFCVVSFVPLQLPCFVCLGLSNPDAAVCRVRMAPHPVHLAAGQGLGSRLWSCAGLWQGEPGAGATLSPSRLGRRAGPPRGPCQVICRAGAPLVGVPHAPVPPGRLHSLWLQRHVLPTEVQQPSACSGRGQWLDPQGPGSGCWSVESLWIPQGAGPLAPARLGTGRLGGGLLAQRRWAVLHQWALSRHHPDC